MTDDETSDSQQVLAAAAGAAGMIGVATLALEVATDRWLARVAGLDPLFISMPLGVGATCLGGLIARTNPARALPALALAVVYWGVLVVFW